MNIKTKKYPLLITTIISCVIVIASLFILGFFGMKLGTSLGGGSQFQIAINDETKAKEYTNIVKDVLADNKIEVDSVFVQDKFVAGENKGEFTTKCLVVKTTAEDVSATVQSKIKTELASKLSVTEGSITSLENITSSVSSKDVLFIGLALGIILVLLFVFAWLRYNIFAGLTFIVAYLHNLILYLSILILTRVELSLLSLVLAIALTLLMSVVLVHVLEKYREQEKLHIDDKLTITERLISVQKQALKPFVFVIGAVLVFALLMFIVPVRSVVFAAINLIIALAVTCYTAILVAPAVFAALSESREARRKAVLSRNDNVNKLIIKKKAKQAK